GDLFPANSELFVNSVCWLAGLEGLVAASPQVQAVIRIGPVDPVQLSRLRWAYTAGIPLLCLLGGAGVWLMRRRG
ncbi:MAG: hypothetical protein JJU36_05985, partial [Phycisphaeraceae bacterium]|nr:hypothetical protein [Phycisphaeraceae bacterium]